VAGVATRLLSRVRVLAGARIFSFLQNVQIESPVQWVRGALSVGGKMTDFASIKCRG
jgi:hypothetical protein